MKIEATVTLTKDELNQYVLDGLKADGKPMPDGVELSVVISNAAPMQTTALVSAIFGTTSARQPSTAPIGQTLNGFKITHYGYPGDSSPDSNSMKGIGDRENKLIPNLSVAMTKSAREQKFGAQPHSTGKQFTLSGFVFQDDDDAPEADPRVDVYDPFYTGVDPGCTPEMLAKSKAEMVAAGILTA